MTFVGFTIGTKGVADGQVEVFPKQNEIAAGGFGNQFILPLAGKSVPLGPDMSPASIRADITFRLGLIARHGGWGVEIE